MSDVMTIRETVQRAKQEGISLSEHALRRWVKTGAIPARKVGQKALLFYPNVIKFLRCEDDSDNRPTTDAEHPGIRRIL